MAMDVNLWGLLAKYDNPSVIYRACEKVRDEGYSRWDACSPFPIHGIDAAMGIKPTKLPWIVLLVGLTGSMLGLFFEAWTSGNSYPFVAGGKPLFSLPAFVPVWFELTILSSCLAAFFANWILSDLPRPHHPAFSSRSFERVTDDAFFIMVEAKDPKFDVVRTRALLLETGATAVQDLEP